MSECTCNQKFRDAEDYRDHLPCEGTREQREIRRQLQEVTTERDVLAANVQILADCGRQQREEWDEKLLQIEEDTIASMRAKAIGQLQVMRRTPRMYFHCREALLAAACHVVCLFLDHDAFNTQDFYKKHAGTEGCAYKDMSVPIEDDWAHAVLDDAIARLSG